MTPKDAGWWLRHGAIGGGLAGLVFMAFGMLEAALTVGTGTWLTPLRMIGAIVLGASALGPSASLLEAATTGLIVHLVLSATFGAVFGWAAWAWLAEPSPRLVLEASAYGLLLWLVNYQMIAPIAGWIWFPAGGSPVVQFVAHTLFFGAPLGLYLSRMGGRVAVRESTLHEHPWQAA